MNTKSLGPKIGGGTREKGMAKTEGIDDYTKNHTGNIKRERSTDDQTQNCTE